MLGQLTTRILLTATLTLGACAEKKEAHVEREPAVRYSVPPINRISAIDNCEETPWFLDYDGDGFGSKTAKDNNGSAFKMSCTQPEPLATPYGMVEFVDNLADCNDDIPTVYPGAPEICDGYDNDCNPETPINMVLSEETGEFEFITQPCGPETACGYAEQVCTEIGFWDYTACAEIPIPEVEVCDYKDNDCDGLIDEGTDKFPIDNDGDGFGVLTDTEYSCTPNLVGSIPDCDDSTIDISCCEPAVIPLASCEPATVIFSPDLSGSTSAVKGTMIEGLYGVEEVWYEGLSAMVIPFAKETQQMGPFAVNHTVFHSYINALVDVDVGGSSNINKAVGLCVTLLEQETIEEPKACFILSDGKISNNSYNTQEINAQAAAAGVDIFFFAVGAFESSKPYMSEITAGVGGWIPTTAVEDIPNYFSKLTPEPLGGTSMMCNLETQQWEIVEDPCVTPQYSTNEEDGMIIFPEP